ncbi:MAG: hypothetical protein ABI051_10710 [Vicinamibacterales bacterium]
MARTAYPGGSDGSRSIRSSPAHGTTTSFGLFELPVERQNIVLANSERIRTAILDDKTSKLVAFASNDQSLTMQQGTFEPLGSAPR